ncbi:MAG TPA: hypothetical protein VF212_06345 [Longimicrobiales bacterium]
MPDRRPESPPEEPSSPLPDAAPMRVERLELPDGRYLLLYGFAASDAAAATAAMDRP